MIALNVQNLTKTIKNKTILNNVSFTVNEGEIIGVKGSNGSGKSMLFKCLSGLVHYGSGEIEYFGKMQTSGVPLENTGILIEYPGFLPQYTGYKNLELLAEINRKIGREEIAKAMEIVGLNAEDRRIFRQYSLGMKQKLGIAQAIMEKPRLLILDEPTSGLDEKTVNDIRNIILQLNQKENVTVLIASHNAEDLEILCNRIYQMSDGILSGG